MKHLFFVLFFFCTVLSAQEKPVLRFPESGIFRIAQITDTHFNSQDASETPRERIAMINTVLD
ncbi:MAG: metallophosphatase, partial [Tannerella sp.]|nr:metallophosphatase [Tannerella sp.]